MITSMLDKMKWFIGVVEDRNDPLKLGRVRVRAIGYHSANLNEIPTKDLPWATVIAPANTNEENVIAPKDGSWVIGFFQNGEECTFPIVIGVLPGIYDTTSVENISQGKGFTDQRVNNGTINDYPKKITEKTYLPGYGILQLIEESLPFPNEQSINQSSISKLARNENIDTTIIKDKQNSIIENKKIARSYHESEFEYFNEPTVPYAAVYPFNHVTESESGHIVEIDDTPGAERIHEYHRTGTFKEIHPNGDEVIKVVGDRYHFIMKNDYLYVSGDCNIVVEGNARIRVEGDSIT